MAAAAEVDRSIRTAREWPPLLRLPYELHCEVVNGLPLASLVLYQSQVCRSLRFLFAGRLTVRRPESFRLVEWRQAQAEVARLLKRDREATSHVIAGIPALAIPATGDRARSIWDTSPSCTPKPAPMLAHPAQAHASLRLLLPASTTLHYFEPQGEASSMPFTDHPDVQLFLRCMRLLDRKASLSSDDEARLSMPLPTLHLATPLTSAPLRVLSLLSRTGFPVAALVHLLHALPALHSVQTVLMTSAGNAETLLWALFSPAAGRLGLASPMTTLAVATPTCLETQAIVVPGPHAERGQGLRSGFKCFCFHSRDTDGNSSSSVPDQSASTTLHVIFHDWYDDGEAEGTQDMLHHSQITCNACKCSIVF